jgi:hypothetical protein
MGAADDIKKGLTKTLATFTAQRKAEEKQSFTIRYRSSRMREVRGEYQTEVANKVMAHCYMKVSDNNTLPALVRQIFYVARPLIEQQTGKPPTYHYFSQRCCLTTSICTVCNVQIGTWSMMTAAILWSRTPAA